MEVKRTDLIEVLIALLYNPLSSSPTPKNGSLA